MLLTGHIAQSHGSWIRNQWCPLLAAGSLGSIWFLRISIQKKGGDTMHRRMKGEELRCSARCSVNGGWEVRKKTRHRVTGGQSLQAPPDSCYGSLLSSSIWAGATWSHLEKWFLLLSHHFTSASPMLGYKHFKFTEHKRSGQAPSTAPLPGQSRLK